MFTAQPNSGHTQNAVQAAPPPTLRSRLDNVETNLLGILSSLMETAHALGVGDGPSPEPSSQEQLPVSVLVDRIDGITSRISAVTALMRNNI